MQNQIPHIILVKPLKNFQLYLKFDDGIEGIVDLSHLKGKGVFEYWEQEQNFEKVYVDNSGALVWNEDIDLDSLNCYLKITNQTFEEYDNR